MIILLTIFSQCSRSRDGVAMWLKFLCHWSHVCFCVVVEKLVRSCDCERASIKYNLPTLFPLPTTLPLLSLSMHFPFPPIKVPPASSNRVPERRLFSAFGMCNTLDNRCGIIFPSTEQFIMIVPRPSANAGFGPIPLIVEFPRG